MERVRAGDGEAFDRLVERHQERAFAVAYRLLANRADAEDVVQEAFLAALEGIDGFRPGHPFGPWLHRIVVNRGLNARVTRSRRERGRVPLEGAIVSQGSGPERAFERRDRQRRLAEALERLDERRADLVRLHYLEGFGSAELAHLFGISAGTVRWHLHEARRELRVALEERARQGRARSGEEPDGPTRGGEGPS